MRAKLLVVGVACSFVTTSLAYNCYNPEGQDIRDSQYSSATANEFTACNSNFSVPSTCCKEGETCGDDNLCRDDRGGIYRQYCTDPDWNTTSCSQLCPQFRGAGTVLTSCADGSFCCGFNNTACCAAGNGTSINAQGQVLLSNGQVSSIMGVSYSSTMASSSTTAAPSATRTSSPPSDSSSSNNIGAIVGGVIGGIAILLIATVIILWVLRQRKRKRDTLDFKERLSGSDLPSYSPAAQVGAVRTYPERYYQQTETAELMSSPRYELGVEAPELAP